MYRDPFLDSKTLVKVDSAHDVLAIMNSTFILCNSNHHDIQTYWNYIREALKAMVSQGSVLDNLKHVFSVPLQPTTIPQVENISEPGKHATLVPFKEAELTISI